MSDERLSTKLEEASRMVLVQSDVWADAIDHARRIESEIDSWPKRRAEDPDTSYYQGSISDLRESQRAVLTIFEFAHPIPLEDRRMISQYRSFEADDFIEIELPPQSESGLRTRRRELVRLGLLELVDREGTSPHGRPSNRYARREGTT